MSDEETNACHVCREDCQYYGIGECNHTVCAKCAIRLRVICRVPECPTCRHKSSRVLVTKTHSPFNNFQLDRFISLPEEDLLFENQEVLDYYKELNSYRCSDCGMQCNSMSALKRHANNDHRKNFCKICIDHLKLFPREHLQYDQAALAEHKRWSSDRPNHGHPKCQICGEYFYDAEMWYNHLRRQHFMCHICENLPNLERFHQQRTVYGNYEQLNKHFVTCHYVCQEGTCESDQFTNVFATENELRAHRISHHSGNMDKALLRETRRLNIDIRYQRGGVAAAASGRVSPHGGGGGGATGTSGGGGVGGAPSTAREALDQLVNLAPGVREFAASALAASAAAAATVASGGYAENPAEFPSLSGETRNFQRRPEKRPDEEDFPSLRPAAAIPPTAANSVAQQQQQSQQPPPPPPPVYSGPRPNPAPASFTSLMKPAPAAGDRLEDYPSLCPSAAAAAAGAGNSVWGAASFVPAPATRRLPATGVANDDFPSLPKPRGPPPTSATAVTIRAAKQQPPKPAPRKPQPSQPQQRPQQQQPSDPVEFRPPGLRYQQTAGSGGGVQLQSDSPAPYRPVTSVSVAPAAPQQPPNNGGGGGRSGFSLAREADDFPSLLTPSRPRQQDDPLADDASDDDDWSAWPQPAPTAVQPQQPHVVTGNSGTRGSAAKKAAAPAAPAGFESRGLSGEDFPSLGASSAPAAPAGGGAVSKKQQKRQKQKQKQLEADAEQHHQQSAAASVGGASAMVKNSSWSELLVRHAYSPPADLLARQSRLLERLRASLDGESFGKFALASKSYLDGHLQADQFVSEVAALFGNEAEWSAVAPDLVTTLPSIPRQRELRLQLADCVRNRLAVCGGCGQTLLPGDLVEHRCLQIED